MNHRRTLATLPVAAVVLIAGLWWATPARALTLTAVPWEKLLQNSELVVKVQLVKWEYENYQETYTLAVSETYKGPKDQKTIVIQPKGRYDSFGPVTLKGEGILFLKKDGDRWIRAVMGPWWWPYNVERKPGHSTVVKVDVGGGLLSQVPADLKKTSMKLLTLLATDKWHEYDAQIYVQADVEAFLKKHVK